MRLTRLFRPPARPRYQFETVAPGAVPSIPDGLGGLWDRQRDGFLLRGVFSPQQVERLLHHFQQIPEEALVRPISGLQMFPRAFSQLDQASRNSTDRLQAYFEENQAFWDGFNATFEVDFQGTVSRTLERIGGERKALTPKGVNDKGTYTPATFKKLVPGEGHLVPHCGNLFHHEFPTFFDHLSSFSAIRNQLSYFVMLSAPDAGGELVLYDVEWKEAQVRNANKNHLTDQRGRLIDLENERAVKRQLIRPEAGDMVVFAGGNIWHKVAHVQGQTDRITIGGFITRSLDDRSVYYWS